MYILEFNKVSKKFRRGEKFNSVRDALPNLLKSALRRRREAAELGKQEFWAVRDVDFRLSRKEVVGIIGPNGAGKSTILKLLSRIMDPTLGEIRINGRLSALIEVTAGFHPELTGRENVYLNGTILGMSKKEVDAKFDEIVDFSGIGEFIDTPVKRYSSGMFSRLGFSVAAHMEPDILLVDEVLAVGDIAFQAKCAQKMRQLLETDTTIVLVSHNLSLVQNLCKRVLLLDKGRVVRDGSAEEIIPFYQDMIYRKTEDDLKARKITAGKVKVNQDKQVEITDVSLNDGKSERRMEFGVGEPFSITIFYDAKKPIQDPVFMLDIFRSDGVLCCSFDTKDAGFTTGLIQNKGKITLKLPAINLAPGIFTAEAGIWDRDMIHPYTFRDRDIFKIVSDHKHKDRGTVVFNPQWETGQV